MLDIRQRIIHFGETILKMKTTKQEIIEELQNGICELTYMDEQSVEHVVSVTLSPNHLDDDDATATPPQEDGGVVIMFNMMLEKWQKIQYNSIIDFERLTGHGIKDTLMTDIPPFFENEQEDDDDV